MTPTYLQFGPASAALHRPQGGKARIGLLVMHRSANYLNHVAAVELAKRGYMVLCMNSRFQNNEVQMNFEKLPRDVVRGVEFLRKQDGMESVLFFAHSGGGPLLSFYQALAENGAQYSQGPNKLTQGSDELDGLPQVDGIIFADAHPGNSVLVLRGLNPSVADDDNPLYGAVNPELDPFNPDNGYNLSGPSQYPTEFRQKYYRAQAARMSRLIEKAQAMKALLANGPYPYPDNDIFLIPRGGPQGSGPGASAYLWLSDPTLAEVNETAKEAKLLKNDGNIVVEKVRSTMTYDRTIASRHVQFDLGTKVLSVNSFLSANAVRARHSIDDIDYESSNNSTFAAVRRISVPVLFAAMGGFFLIRDNERLFEVSASKDKDFIVVEGAGHFITPIRATEREPGAFDNCVYNLFDYVDEWIRARY
ncbi:MAG: hypothetical protein KF807_01595 [Xanthobacteraceae bacterium]|nr:hypothetical protein [Xanthobacteraceae bacterium]